MLYYNFKNYEEFKTIFGYTKHGNGTKSRKNKILLAYLKNPKLLKQARVYTIIEKRATKIIEKYTTIAPFRYLQN